MSLIKFSTAHTRTHTRTQPHMQRKWSAEKHTTLLMKRNARHGESQASNNSCVCNSWRQLLLQSTLETECHNASTAKWQAASGRSGSLLLASDLIQCRPQLLPLWLPIQIYTINCFAAGADWVSGEVFLVVWCSFFGLLALPKTSCRPVGGCCQTHLLHNAQQMPQHEKSFVQSLLALASLPTTTTTTTAANSTKMSGDTHQTTRRATSPTKTHPHPNPSNQSVHSRTNQPTECSQM